MADEAHDGAKRAPSEASGGGQPGKQQLKRVLTVPDMIVYGLIFMVPIAPMGIYGGVFSDSGGMPALVYLVEDHRAHTVEARIPQQPTQQHPGRHHLDARGPADDALAAHREADDIAHGGPGQVGEAPRRRPGGNPSRLRDDDPALHDARDDGGRQRRLAGAGRGLDDGNPTPRDGPGKGGRGRGEGQAAPVGGQLGERHHR